MLEDKKNVVKSVITQILSYLSKATVILLFVFMFIGRMNPARISKVMNTNVSLVKSALYFKGYTSDLVALQNAKKTESSNSELENLAETSGDSFDDYYSNFAAMVADTSAYDMVDGFDDDDEEETASGKIKVRSYKKEWAAFKAAHSQIANAVEKAHKYSIFTLAAILICVIGLYLSCGTNKIRKIGYLVICAGAVLVSLSMIPYGYAYDLLAGSLDSLEVSPIPPSGISGFISFSIITFVLALALFVIEKAPEGQKSELKATPFQITYRLLALLLFILLFIPGANPARISLNISRNVSLFTSGFSYGTYVRNMERILVRGWLPSSVMRIAYFSSLLACLGIIACGVGSCISVGNNKLKRYAHISIFAGSALSFVSMFGIVHAYNLITSSENVERIEPLEPSTVPMYCILLALICICAVISFIKTPAPEKDEKPAIEAPLQLFLMILPFLILVFIFAYLPLWGWRYAFFDYNAGDTLSMDAWVGWKWFKAPFENAATRNDIIRVLRNTLAMSGLGIATSWLPMIFAIFLSEIKNQTSKKIIQTLTTIPNFISWVLVYAIAFCIFGTEGFISSLMVNSGFWERGKNMLMGDSFIWVKMWLWGTWKGLGWSAIMYIAAISGIDQQLYEAATVDGAGRFQKMWHITLPGIKPMIVVLLVMNLGYIMGGGFERPFAMKNNLVINVAEVISTFVYKVGIQQLKISLTTAVGLFQSVVGLFFLLGANALSRKLGERGIF
jgi:putative aldouronate transport system permease protein